MKMVVPEKPCHLFQLLSFISASGKFLIFLEDLGKCHRQFALYALHAYFAECQHCCFGMHFLVARLFYRYSLIFQKCVLILQYEVIPIIVALAEFFFLIVALTRA